MSLAVTIIISLHLIGPVIVMAILFDQRIMNEPMLLASEVRVGDMIVSIEEIKKIKVGVRSEEQLALILKSMRELEAEYDARNRLTDACCESAYDTASRAETNI